MRVSKVALFVVLMIALAKAGSLVNRLQSAHAQGYASAGVSQERINMLRAEFAKYDADNSGHIDREELKNLLRDFGHHSGEVEKYMKKYDLDSNGTLEFDEFAALLHKLNN